ncbi:CHAT domain-containing protein [Aporhodopirellula aestuarii]|uniref:CHAT domain-containing protein n=1 Tax=Aporhodopirellula aestuarii TaxID=2950107 RepID=A0ABT0U960_9BACT|nr:CHAT domain-containing protein [Aporhodopirellula aestuarii]MCM2373462.1 CHAT domain-containing protein [Aporhodopirellula aestuarii]
MRRSRFGLWFVLIGMVATAFAADGPEGTNEPLSPTSVSTSDPLLEAKSLFAKQQGQAAIAAAEAVLPRIGEAPDEPHWVTPLTWLAARYEEQGDWTGALKNWQRAYNAQVALAGREHWRSLGIGAEIGFVQGVLNREESHQNKIQDAGERLFKAKSLREQGKSDEAVRLLRQVLESYEQTGFTNSHRYGLTLMELGICFREQDELDQSETRLRQGMEVIASMVGDYHPLTAECMAELAWVFHSRSETFLTRQWMRWSAESLQQTVGEQDRRFILRVEHLAMMLTQQLDYDSALDLLKFALGLRENLSGKGSPTYIKTLTNLAAVFVLRGELQNAEPLLQESLAYYESARHNDPSGYANALNYQFYIAMQRQDMLTAEKLMLRKIEQLALAGDTPPIQLAQDYKSLGAVQLGLDKCVRALDAINQSLRIHEEIGDTSSLQYAQTQVHLAIAYQALGQIEAARKTYEVAVAVFVDSQQTLTDEYAVCLENMAHLEEQQGQYVRAEHAYTLALEVREKISGKDSFEYLSAMAQIAKLTADRGYVTSAREKWTQLSRLVEESQGTSSEAYVYCLLGTARTYRDDDPRKLQELKKAIATAKSVAGEQSFVFREGLDELGKYHASQGEIEEAIEVFRRLARIEKEFVGEQSRSHLQTLSSLARMYLRQQDWEQSTLLFEQILAHQQRRCGEENLVTIQARAELAEALVQAGEFSKVTKHYAENARVSEQLYGKHAFETIRYWVALADNHMRLKNQSEAEKLYREMLQRELKSSQTEAVRWSIVQHVRSSGLRRHLLNAILTLSRERPTQASENYRFVLAWKGQQLSSNLQARSQGDPEVKAQLAELQRLDTLLSAHLLQDTDPIDPLSWQRKGEQLMQEKERVASLLSQQANRMANQASTVDVQAVIESLPHDVVLVDIVEFQSDPWRQPSRRAGGQDSQQDDRNLVAFLLGSGFPIQAVHLGPSAKIDEQINLWRNDFGNSRDSHQAGVDLRRLLWEPLLPFVRQAQHVLICPDGPVTQIPLGALPGAKPGTYLIEETSLSVWPAARVLPDLLTEDGWRDEERSILLVGGVNYDSDVLGESAGTGDSPTPSREPAMKFRPLPGAEQEIRQIHDLHQELWPQEKRESLTQDEPIESVIRDRLPHYQYVHLATHGFYFPAQAASVTVKNEFVDELISLFIDRMQNLAQSPGILSGMALAGANRPYAEFDGVLTAEEVVSLDLSRVQLVVLSACETGLGFDLHASSEGLFGLQRAFHVAGARSAIASLWTVPDQGTRELMERFYANLWERKMGKAAALREAQLWILNDHRSVEDVDSSRGLTAIDEQTERSVPKRLPPYHWAAFTLSGDWR